MKILKQFFSVLFVLLCVVGTGYAATFDGVRELVSRRAPWLGKHIQFKEIASSDGDCFILQTVGKKLVVQATGANAAAVGVNWYLKYYCHRSMSHLGDQLAPVTELPVIGQPVTVKTTSIYRYALNYCTFNYTMSFYDWDDWQWELDWMALNGVNLMLVANGSEAVWQNTLRRMNYSEKEIADFITGPAYNAWWLMGNIEGWGGPMPQSQIDSRKKLVQKMLKRMKSLGIEPLMPGVRRISFRKELGVLSPARIFWILWTRSSIVLQPSFMTKPAVCTVRTSVSSPATLFMREELRTA